MASRYELTAAQWRRIEAIVPGKAGDRGRTAADNRTFVSGVMWVLRSGAHWKHLPEGDGDWKITHKRFTRWANAGVWGRVFAAGRPKEPICGDRLGDRPRASTIGHGKGGTRARLWGVPEADRRRKSTRRRMPRAAHCASS
jgi:transposase